MLQDVLKDLRKQAGLSQTALAKRLGVSRSSIYAYEAGTREPGNEMLVKMSNIFGRSVDFLLTGNSGLVTSKYAEYVPEEESASTDDAMDARLAVLFDDLRNREDVRKLMEIVHGSTPEEVQQAAKIMEALRKE